MVTMTVTLDDTLYCHANRTPVRSINTELLMCAEDEGSMV